MSSRHRIQTFVVAVLPALLLAACSVSTAGKAEHAAALCRPAGASESAVAPTIRCYFRAVSKLDTETACQTLSAALRAHVVRGGEDGASGIVDPDDDSDGSSGETCAQVMRGVLDHATPQELADLRLLANVVRVRDVVVTGNRARAGMTAVLHGAYSSTHNLQLVQESGYWRIDSTFVYETD